MRDFRFDRIRAVIDLDGVVHEPPVFFRNELRFPLDVLTISVESSKPKPPELPEDRQRRPESAAVGTLAIENPGLAPRRAARDGLRVLAALGRVDGFLHEAEVAVIFDYIVERAAIDGIDTGEEDREALLPYLRRQFPNAAVVDECLDRLAAETPEQRRLFLRHAVALMDADGIHHPAEFDMALGLKGRLN